MKSSELSNGENRIALRQLLQNRKWRHLWRHNLGSRWKLQKMARENFNIGAFYNITKNQDNPFKTVGRDSFLSLQGSHRPYILGDTTRPRHITCSSLIEIGSKTAEKNSAQTNRQTFLEPFFCNFHLEPKLWRHKWRNFRFCRFFISENIMQKLLTILYFCIINTAESIDTDIN